MKPVNDATGVGDAAPVSTDTGSSEATGLPWLRTWRGVYLFVIGCFAACVALLALFTRVFS